VSWLNARAKDTVRLKMEKDLWSEAHALVDELQRKEGRPADEHGVKDETMGDDGVSDG
jgi:hypothetical protein